MKFKKNIFRLSLVMIMGLVVATCQREETVVLISEDESDTEVPKLKSVVYNEDHWLHLNNLTFPAIQDLVEEGFLSTGNANALIVKYDAAKKNLLKGNYDAASGILTAFMDLADDFVDEGKISDNQRDNLIMVPSAIIESFNYQCGDPIYDVRDGQSYKTVQIGGQCWLAENLNFDAVTSDGDKCSWYYNNDSEYGDNYGSLYSVHSYVRDVACPIGWHLPSDEEWKTLEKYLGMTEDDANTVGVRYSGNVSYKLKSTSGWKYNGNGDNSSGFNALPGGSGNFSSFGGEGICGFFWSSTPCFHSYYYRQICWENGVKRDDTYRALLSVRCVKNE